MRDKVENINKEEQVMKKIGDLPLKIREKRLTRSSKRNENFWLPKMVGQWPGGGIKKTTN